LFIVCLLDQSFGETYGWGKPAVIQSCLPMPKATAGSKETKRFVLREAAWLMDEGSVLPAPAVSSIPQ
jgi:hypothetical protein